MTPKPEPIYREDLAYIPDVGSSDCVLGCYHEHGLATRLRQTGFQVQSVRMFGEFPLFPKRVGFLAQKPQ